MVTVAIDSSVVKISVRGIHKVLAMTGSLEIPLASIEFAERASALAREGPSGTRNLGTSIPYVINAGSFNAGVSRSFWDVHNPDKAIRIKLKSSPGLFAGLRDRYDEIVVEVADPVETLAELTGALSVMNRHDGE